ncbi:hypothetical protein ACTQ54_01865 [Fundicoccus sp. Sow4_H7]|uniref:hypothetical protein n=1 Tax=Fundicoccus sp. Sow4_H7 TaxID=3438784 RepID=UPI003F91A36F
MKVIDMLMDGDIVIQQLTSSHLLDQKFNHNNKGLIADYLAIYDEKKFGAVIFIQINGFRVRLSC